MSAINVENAKINTASIEIKTLTVSNRQLTMGTFRQIEEDHLIDFKLLKLNGIPWGRINYFWGDNGCEDVHFHIIWQKDNEIKRSIIKKYFHCFDRKSDIEDFYIGSEASYLLFECNKDLHSEYNEIRYKKEKLKELEEKKLHFDIRPKIENQINLVNNLLNSLKDLPQLFIAT